MNTLNTKKYLVTVIVQYLILLFDVFVNSFAGFSRQNPINLLILYVIQDLCLVMTLTVLLVNFFSTYIFQVGLIQLLYTKFRITLILCIIYMILSISLHTWDIKMNWSSPFKYHWTKDFHVFYSLHRGVAVLYYYFYKRASLRIADPRFYESSTWMQN
ncbi:transmembrane protein 138 isoform X2 [Ptiloglossa arizonensis]|uniref:transmembrane protein 138 isoform X2 n=1 Tax=Ptiloglossa arizonensis TaxID=3350558 RepID=UPI003FA135DF